MAAQMNRMMENYNYANQPRSLTTDQARSGPYGDGRFALEDQSERFQEVSATEDASDDDDEVNWITTMSMRGANRLLKSLAKKKDDKSFTKLEGK